MFPSESVLVSSRYRVSAALCPLAVAPRCDLTGSARVRKHRAKDSVRLREPPPPGGESSLLLRRLRGSSNRASPSPPSPVTRTGQRSHRVSGWGCSGRLPGPPQPPSPSRRACALRTGPKIESGAPASEEAGPSCLATAVPPNPFPAKPQTSSPLAQCARPGSGAFSTRLLRAPLPAHVLGSSSAIRSASRPCSADESRIPSAPCGSAWIRSSLGFLFPFQGLLSPTRSGSRRGTASLRHRRFPRLRAVNGQLTMVSRGSPRIGSRLPIRQNPGLSPSIPLRGVLADPSGLDFAVAFRLALPPTTPRKGRPVNRAAPGAEPRTFLGVS